MPKLQRANARTTLILAVLVGGLCALPSGLLIAGWLTGVAAEPATATGTALAIALLAVPAVLTWSAARAWRHVPRLPEVALTITPSTIEFPAMEVPGARGIQRRAVTFRREWTTVEFLPRKALQADALAFRETSPAGKARVRKQATQHLDTPASVIIEAVTKERTA